MDPIPLAAVPEAGGGERLLTDLGAALADVADVHVSRVLLGEPSDNPIQDVFRAAALLAGEVRAAGADGSLVIVLANACLSALGSCSALEADARSVAWLDAHGDFNTPDTTETGLLDGMTLAILTGRCWTALARGIPGFRPVAESSVTLIGARDLDDGESDALAAAEIRRRDPAVAGHVRPPWPSEGDLYVHLDLDVLDPSVGRANRLASPGGVSAEALEALFVSLGKTAPVKVVALTAYDPDEDTGGGAAAASVRAVRSLVLHRSARGP